MVRGMPELTSMPVTSPDRPKRRLNSLCWRFRTIVGNSRKQSELRSTYFNLGDVVTCSMSTTGNGKRPVKQKMVGLKQ